MATIQSKTTKGYKYWYIVESRRVNGKPRPIVLAYLGKAEDLLKQAYEIRPDLPDLAYSLGLLLVEKNKLNDAVRYLKIAADQMPERARIQYNLGLLLQSQNQLAEAETCLLLAFKIEPDNMDYLYALAIHYINRQMPLKAKSFAEKMVEINPQLPIGNELLNAINQRIK